MELKNRIIVVSEKNMDELVSLYGKCSMDEVERIVNNIISNAVAEIREDERKLHMSQQETAQMSNCAECKFMKEYGYENRVYYCDHEGRSDDMGKLGVGELTKTSPMWCPLRTNIRG